MIPLVGQYGGVAPERLFVGVKNIKLFALTAFVFITVVVVPVPAVIDPAIAALPTAFTFEPTAEKLIAVEPIVIAELLSHVHEVPAF